MSKPVRIAFVVEGPTDFIVLRAGVSSLLGDRDFEATVIWPELDDSLLAQTGGGWGAVYLWCRQMVEQAGGTARDNPLFGFHDILVVQVDADVAGKRYGDDQRIQNPPIDLPCEQPCPPPQATTDALRRVILGWLNENIVPPRTVLCIPSKSVETWVLAALFPNDEVAAKANIECRRDGEIRLRKYGLIKSGQKLIEKYLENEGSLRNAWASVRAKCTEAERFSRDLLAVVPAN